MVTAAVPKHPDSELEQAIIRVVVGFIASVYLVMFSPKSSILITVIAFLAFAVAILMANLLRANPCPSRRIIGMLGDLGTTSLVLYSNGNFAAPLFIVYLWVTFGNGFRFGVKYLALSAVLSIAGFSSVLYGNSYWSKEPHLAGGLLTGLIVLPLYVGMLLKKLTNALARAEATNETRAQFLANVSHEVRTPMSGILGLAELLLECNLAEQPRRYAERIQSSAEWLLKTHNKILDFTAITAGQLQLEETPLEVRTLAHDIVDLFREANDKPALEFTCHVAAEVPVAVTGDSYRIHQILQYLMENACKFTERGSIDLTVSVNHQSGSRDMLTFSISDTGIGVSAAAQATIFEPFTQADGSLARKYGGTGLGLSIARQLAEAMQGRLDCEAPRENGAVFVFSIPLREVPFDPQCWLSGQGAKPGQNESIYGSCKWQRVPQILVVEDNPLIQEIISDMLKRLGCEPKIAADGERALPILMVSRFDLVLMDCQMPGVDGLEVTRRFRAYEKTELLAGHAGTPVVAFTAHVIEEEKQRCLEAGMNDFLGKPFRLRELLAMLEKWLPTGLRMKKELVHAGTAEESDPASVEPAQLPQPEPDNSTRTRKTATTFIVHDLNNILMGILGNAELIIQKSDPKGPERRYAERIIKSTEQTREIIARLRGLQMPS